MNTLETYLTQAGLDPCHAMNLLQDHGGIISDNCVHAADVAECDCPGAVAFLQNSKDTSP